MAGPSSPAANASLQEAIDRLDAGDFRAAFAAADRLCRTVQRDARLYHLRSRARRALGQNEAADRDLEEAFTLDPTDPWIARSILATDLPRLHGEAAASLIASPRADFASQRLALRVLFTAGREAIARLHVAEGRLSGWVAWPAKAGSGNISLRFDGHAALALAVDPDHRLADEGVRATDIAWPVDVDADGALDETSMVQLLHEGVPLTNASVTVRHLLASSGRAIAGAARDRFERGCTVIVPIYGDAAATRLCLASLSRQGDIGGRPLRVVLVNDNPSNYAIADVVHRAATRYGFETIANTHNLGFVLSVNKALSTVEGDDVLLLNADTVIPPGAIDRLRNAAYGEADIGTVTPLSNNGELTSFPHPLHARPIESAKEIGRIDALAREVNRGTVVTVPAGTGFCLYVRADCLAAVGALSHRYERGYYEDIEFCMQARRAGFRNVCATDVYVGHAGTRSFGSEKRGLVERNSRICEARFPGFVDEVTAFARADPLRAARAAITRRQASPGEIGPGATGPGVALLGPHAARSLDVLAHRLREDGLGVLLLIRSGEDKIELFIGKGADEGKFDDSFALTQPGEAKRIADMLRRRGIDEIGMFDRLEVPAPLAPLVAEKLLFRPLIDACPFLPRVPGAPTPCPAPKVVGPCDSCKATRGPVSADQAPFFAAMTGGGPRSRPLNAMAASLLRCFDRHADDDELDTQSSVRRDRYAVKQIGLPFQSFNGVASEDAAAPEPRAALGLLIGSPGRAGNGLLRRLGESPERIGMRQPLIVLGSCLDSAAIESLPFVTVTGLVTPRDMRGMLAAYCIDGLVSLDRWGGLSEVEALAHLDDLPCAYFDWSFGLLTRRADDLSLDPRICDDKAIAQLLQWAQRIDRRRGDQ